MYNLKISSSDLKSFRETQNWVLEINNVVEDSFQVEVLFSKPIDILSLKSKGHIDFSRKVEQLSSDRESLFKSRDDLIQECPICSASNSDHILTVYNANYRSCLDCSHKYVSNRLTQIELENYYRNSLEYQSTYTNYELALKRVNEIQVSKLEYIIEQYRRNFGRYPRKILDIGAGSGHFGQACKLKSIDYVGVELSHSGIDFAKSVFNIELIDIDVINNHKHFIDENFDIITFWGLLEHVPDPELMLEVGKNILINNSQGMITGSVPRFNSISSIFQILFPEQIIRHLDPLGHIQMFTDTSLVTLLNKCDIDLKSVWYFGMDAYELFLNLSNKTKTDILINPSHIALLQQFIDQNKLSDSLIFTTTTHNDKR